MKPGVKTAVLRLALCGAVLCLALLGGPTPSDARELQPKIPMTSDALVPAPQAPGSAVLGQVPSDTFYFGGTVWDAAQGRWEAAEPSAAGWANKKMWTWNVSGFGGTPHSGLNMDGWVGVDANVDTSTCFRVMDGGQIGGCVIAGTKSLFCGRTGAEAHSLCYADGNGTGYGNDWHQMIATPAFDFEVGDQIALAYDYAIDTEPGYDFVDVLVEHYDSGTGAWVEHASGSWRVGIESGSDVVDVDSYLSSVGNVQFRIKFVFTSDESFSDEDGAYATSCGACAFDNVALSGSVTYSEDFEDEVPGALPTGWQKVSAPCGEFAQARHVSELPVSMNEDPCVLAEPGMCGIADSVLILADLSAPSYPHPECQDSYVMSPVIDLSSRPDLGGKVIRLERFFKLPLNDHIFVIWRVRYAPGCDSGAWSPWSNDYYVYYSTEGTSCSPWLIDASSYVPLGADEVQIALGVVNYCDNDPWGLGCTNASNATPYFDNVTFGAYGGVGTPYISMREYDYWQDQFTEDGLLNPAGTADTRTAVYQSNLVPPIFGDTLVCRGSSDNMEVYLVFRMARVGPEQKTTNNFFTSWFPGVAGGGWVEVRMDTAEVTTAAGNSTSPVPGNWMCAFHEEDPVRVANGIAEGTEILPNNLFVPGTRVEYFLKARYAGSADCFVLPDTTGGHQAEFEILPMMTYAGSGRYSSPCLLVVDHFGGRGNGGETNADRIARHLKAKGIKFDIFNRLGPASDLRNGIGRWNANPGQIGSPGTPKYNWGPGATTYQMAAYRYCIVNTGNIYSYSLYQKDTDLLKWWLDNAWDVCDGGQKLLWLSGDKVYRELSRRSPWGTTFLNSTLCATYVANLYQAKTGDYTYCLPMDGVAGGSIGDGNPEDYVIATQACPRIGGGGQNVIGVSPLSGCTAVAEIEYHAGYDGTRDLAAVSRVNTVGAERVNRILTEAYDFCLIRSDDSQGMPACGSDSYLSERIDSVLSWAKYDTTLFCGYEIQGDYFPFAGRIYWHTLAADSNKVMVCPGVAEWPEVDTCKSAWVDVYVTDGGPCLDPVGGVPVELTITSSTCDSLLCASLIAYTDANGYVRMYIRGSVNAGAGPGCCTVRTAVACYGGWPLFPEPVNTLKWLSPDLNGDGIVDPLDVGILTGDFGTSACRSDFNCDGIVDEGDLDILEEHYRHSCTGRVIAVEEAPGGLPVATSLGQNYPNPFNPATEIRFAVAEPGHVVLRIYDIVGRPVRTLLDGRKERGYYGIVWDGRDDSGRPMASGVYFYSIQAPGCEERKKMVLIR